MNVAQRCRLLLGTRDVLWKVKGEEIKKTQKDEWSRKRRGGGNGDEVTMSHWRNSCQSQNDVLLCRFNPSYLYSLFKTTELTKVLRGNNVRHFKNVKHKHCTDASRFKSKTTTDTVSSYSNCVGGQGEKNALLKQEVRRPVECAAAPFLEAVNAGCVSSVFFSCLSCMSNATDTFLFQSAQLSLSTCLIAPTHNIRFILNADDLSGHVIDINGRLQPLLLNCWPAQPL